MRFVVLKKLLAGLVLAIGTLFFLMPPELVQAAGLIPCATSGNNVPCTLCHLIIGGKGVIDYLMELMTFVGLAVITAMGALYIVSTGNENLMKTAKGGIFAAAGGFALMLSGWLIVQTVMWSLSAKTDLGIGITEWNTFTCSTVSKVGTSQQSTTGGPTGPPNTGTGVGTGGCSPLTAPGNPCSVSNLQGTCFASRAEQASSICHKESSGQPLATSGSDNCKDGTTMSWGLFQINLVSEGSHIDSRCANLFQLDNPSQNNGGCIERRTNSNGLNYCHVWGCSVKPGRQSDYQFCVQRMTDSAANIQQACRLYQSRGFQPWTKSAGVCGIPH